MVTSAHPIYDEHDSVMCHVFLKSLAACPTWLTHYTVYHGPFVAARADMCTKSLPNIIVLWYFTATVD